MNNLSEFDRIFKDKIDSFEYPYEEASWMKFKKSIPGKSNFWGFAAAFSIVAISIVGVVWYINTNNSNKAISKNEKNEIQSTNNNYTKIETINESSSNNIKLNNDNKSNNVVLTDNNENSVVENKEENTTQIPVTVIKSDDNKVSQTNQKPVSPNASFICDSKIGCSPLAVRFTPAELSDSMIYSWDFGDGKISTEKRPSHVYSKPGNYSVLLMVKYFKSEPVISNLQQNIIKIYDNPTAQFTESNQENAYSFSNQSIGANKYQWLFPDSFSNDENSSILFKTKGKYSVRLIATSINGCSDTATKNIEVKIKLPVRMDVTSFTPNGDGGNDYFGPQVENPNDYFFVFEIINLNNKCVYLAKGSHVEWDGINKFTGQPSETGWYFYKLKAKDKFENVEEFNGKVYLNR